MHAPSRREALALAASAATSAATLASAGGLWPAQAEPTRETLAGAAKAGRLLYGTAAGPEIFTDPAYRKLVTEEASIFVPQDSLKFGSLQPEQGRFTFSEADALVAGARDAGLLVRGHNLFWNDWVPPWVGKLSHDEIARVFDIYLDTVVPHFAGLLQSWDVVNEPFYLGGDHPGTYRPGPWYDALGPDYIFKAFRRTAELDPQAKLVLNEAWTERSDPIGLAVRTSLLRLIDEMQDKGLKLDAIGLQGHLTPSIPYDDAGFADFLGEIAQRNLDIYISEFDVCDRSYPTDVAQRDDDVAARTTAFLRTVLANPAVKVVITWGASDRYTWWREPEIMVDYGYDFLPRPLPYDDILARKPMWHAMADAFRGRGSRG